jgi:hypothetical protein
MYTQVCVVTVGKMVYHHCSVLRKLHNETFMICTVNLILSGYYK